MRRIIEHPVFTQWLNDHQTVTRFRDAGHFWGIAPGTPTRVVRERVQSVEQLLDQADHALNERGVDQLYVAGGRAAFRSPSNLQLLCPEHHADKTAHEVQLIAADNAQLAR